MAFCESFSVKFGGVASFDDMSKQFAKVFSLETFLLYGILTKGEGYISQYTAEGGGAGYFDRLLTNFHVLVCLCPSTT